MDNFRDSYFNVTWDLTKKHLRGTFWGKQYDTGRGFAVTIVEGGQVTVPSTETVRLKWEKPDSTEGYVTAVVVDNKFLIEDIDQMFTVHGAVRSDLEIWRGGKVISSITFYVSVEKAVAVDAIESSSQFTALQEALSEVGDMQAQVDAVIANATVDSEVILARGTEPTLGDRLDVADAQLAEIENEVNTIKVKSSNLFDITDATKDSALMSDGSGESYNTQYYTSKFIACESSQTYTGFGLSRAYFYDKDKNYLGLTSGANSADSLLTAKTFTSRPLSKYMKISVYKQVASTAQLNRGEILLPYEKSGEWINNDLLRFDVDKIIFEVDDQPVIDLPIDDLYDNAAPITTTAAEVLVNNSPEIYALYNALMADYPDYITRTLLGNETSPDALPIYRYDFNPVRPVAYNTTKQAKMLIVSGVHPEKTGVYNTYHTLKAICDYWSQNPLLEALRFNVHFIVVPIASPWAYDNDMRTNVNGVDISRNFPADWVQGVYGEGTYGGNEPLSEVEAQLVNQIMIDNPDLISAIDVHNYNEPANGYQFLWPVPANNMTLNIALAMIQRLDRKWKKQYSFMNQSSAVFIGECNVLVPGGTLARQANFMGIKGALTFETSWRVYADASGARDDINTLTMGHEALTNLILMLLDNL